jgi:hypothetical protein
LRSASEPSSCSGTRTASSSPEPLLAGAEHAILVTRAAGAELSQQTVGYVASFTRRLVTPAFDTFHETHPQTEVTIHFAGFLDPRGGLRDGQPLPEVDTQLFELAERRSQRS